MNQEIPVQELEQNLTCKTSLQVETMWKYNDDYMKGECDFVFILTI
jgi:hypothetical protein